MGPLATATATPTPQTEYSTMTPIAALRRKNSLGPLRRAHPASGATWNVEVIRGKMTSRCLWHACRALVLGMVLMVLGAGMATIGKFTSAAFLRMTLASQIAIFNCLFPLVSVLT